MLEGFEHGNQLKTDAEIHKQTINVGTCLKNRGNTPFWIQPLDFDGGLSNNTLNLGCNRKIMWF